MTNTNNSNDIFPFATLNNEQLNNIFDIFQTSLNPPVRGPNVVIVIRKLSIGHTMPFALIACSFTT